MIFDRSVLLLGRQPLFVAGMRSAFCGRHFCQIAEAAAEETVPEAVARLRPDAVLLDIGSDEAGFDIVPGILETHPRVRLIVLAASECGEHAVRALEAGAAGYLTSRSTPEELVEATRLVLEGQTFVSPTAATQVIAAMRQAAARQAEARRTGLNLREEQIVVHLLQGHTNREIAAGLGLREKTVKHYMTLLMQKFDVRNRLELALHLRQRGGVAVRGGGEMLQAEVGRRQPSPATRRADLGRAVREGGFSQMSAA